MNKPNAYQALVKTLEHKEQLEKQLANVEQKGYELSNTLDRTRRTIADSKNAVEGLRARYQSTQYISDKQNLDQELERLDAAKTRLGQEQEQFNVCQEDAHRLKSELYNLSTQCEIAQILEHQKTLAAEQEEERKFQELIQRQQIIASASQKPDRLSPLLRKREELLVAIALDDGKNQKKDLEHLDHEIETIQAEEQEKERNNQKSIAHARQTIAGLEKRLAVVRNRLQALQRLTPQIIDQFLQNQAEAVAHEYQQTATKLIGQVNQLATLDRLINEIGQRPHSDLFPKEWWNLLIPKLKTMTAKTKLNGDDYHFVNIRNGSVPAAEVVDEMRGDYIAQGIHWPNP